MIRGYFKNGNQVTTLSRQDDDECRYGKAATSSERGGSGLFGDRANVDGGVGTVLCDGPCCSRPAAIGNRGGKK